MKSFKLPANCVPPLVASNQSIVSPAPAVADNVTVPVEHLETLLPLADAGNAFTVAITAVLDDDVQPVAVVLASA